MLSVCAKWGTKPQHEFRRPRQPSILCWRQLCYSGCELRNWGRSAKKRNNLENHLMQPFCRNTAASRTSATESRYFQWWKWQKKKVEHLFLFPNWCINKSMSQCAAENFPLSTPQLFFVMWDAACSSFITVDSSGLWENLCIGAACLQPQLVFCAS